MSDYMTTFSGNQVDPLDPHPDAIMLEDIAHALSLLCRGGGHLRYFYSVGQHSINCAIEAQARKLSSDIVLACLLHDSSEAYLSDIIRPVKKHLPQYLSIEAALQDAVWRKFGLVQMSKEDLETVFFIDDLILAHEMFHLMKKDLQAEAGKLLGACDFSLKQSVDVEEMFLSLAHRFL